MRGADVSSDHHLHMATVRLHTWTKYNVGLLRNKDTQAAFQISLSYRFQLLQELIEDEMDIETQCRTLRSSGTTQVKRSLARRRHSTRNGSLLTPSTSWKQGERGKLCWTTAGTRAAKAKAQEEYTGKGTGRVYSSGQRSKKEDQVG